MKLIKEIVIIFLYEIELVGHKQTYDGRQSAPSMDIRSTRGVTGSLLAFQKEIRFILEGLKVFSVKKIYNIVSVKLKSCS